MKTVQHISKQLGYEWTVLAYELGFTRMEVRKFQIKEHQKGTQAETMLQCW